MKSTVKRWYNKLPEIGYQMKPYNKEDIALLPSRGKGDYDADLYFGNGYKQNGNNQTVTISINATVNTIAYFKNGLLIIDETPQTLTDYTTDINSADTYQNFIFYKGTFEPNEKRFMKTNPEMFLYSVKQTDGTFIIKSEILSQSKINDVVAYLPMCETDGYIRNMVGYNKGANIVPITEWAVASGTTISGDVVTFDGSQSNYTGATRYIYPTIGKSYLITVNIVSASDISQAGIRFGSEPWTSFAMLGAKSLGLFSFIRTATEDKSYDRIFAKANFKGKIQIFSQMEVTDIYPITNFTNSCRDGANSLPYGPQCCFWEIGSFGIPVDNSFKSINYSGTGYVDTKWIPNNVFQVEEIVIVNGTATHYVYDNNGNKYINGSADGTYTVPTTSTILKVNTFDGAVGINIRTMCNVYTKLQDPAVLYTNAVKKGLL